MKEWLTAQEIAAEQLPDLPATQQGVSALILRDSWNNCGLSRRRAGSEGGGGFEYHFTLFPALAQIAYRQRHMEPIALPAPAKPTPDTSLSGRAQKERDARLAIVAAFESFSRGLQLGYATRVQVFSDKYNAGSIAVDQFARDVIPTISKRSLARWQSEKRNGRANALAHDPAAARKGTGVIDSAHEGAVRMFILGLIANQPHLCADDIRTQCRAEFGDTLKVVSRGVQKTIPMPPVRTFQHTIKHLKTATRSNC